MSKTRPSLLLHHALSQREHEYKAIFRQESAPKSHSKLSSGIFFALYFCLPIPSVERDHDQHHYTQSTMPLRQRIL